MKALCMNLLDWSKEEEQDYNNLVIKIFSWETLATSKEIYLTKTALGNKFFLRIENGSHENQIKIRIVSPSFMDPYQRPGYYWLDKGGDLVVKIWYNEVAGLSPRKILMDDTQADQSINMLNGERIFHRLTENWEIYKCDDFWNSFSLGTIQSRWAMPQSTLYCHMRCSKRRTLPLLHDFADVNSMVGFKDILYLSTHSSTNLFGVKLLGKHIGFTQSYSTHIINIITREAQEEIKDSPKIVLEEKDGWLYVIVVGETRSFLIKTNLKLKKRLYFVPQITTQEDIKKVNVSYLFRIVGCFAGETHDFFFKEIYQTHKHCIQKLSDWYPASSVTYNRMKHRQAGPIFIFKEGAYLIRPQVISIGNLHNVCVKCRRGSLSIVKTLRIYAKDTLGVILPFPIINLILRFKNTAPPE